MKVERLVITLFIGALVAVAIIGYYAHENFNLAENTGYTGRHSHTVIETIYRIELEVAELENASDKYRHSGQSYYAALFHQNEDILNKSIQNLGDSVNDTPFSSARATAERRAEVQEVSELTTLISGMEKALPGFSPRFLPKGAIRTPGDSLAVSPKGGKPGIEKRDFASLSKENDVYESGEGVLNSVQAESLAGENVLNTIIAKGNQIINEESKLLMDRRNVSSETRLNLVRATYFTAGAALLFIFILLLWLNRDIGRRREVEVRIRRNEEKLRETLEGVGDVIYSSNHSGRFTFINSRLGTLTGYIHDELLGKHFTILIHPDWVEKVKEFYLQQFKNKIYETRYEFPILTKQGELKWVEQNVVMVSKGKMVDGFQCVVRDITQRKNTEEEIRRTNQFLDSVLENIPDMIFIKDAKDLRFLRFNKAGEKLLGYSQDDLLGKNDFDFFPREQAEFFTGKDREVFTYHKGIDITEEPISTKNGARWLHTKKIPVYDSEGKPLYLLGISEDITEKKKTDDTIIELNKSLARYVAELEESQRFYKTIARNFPDGTITVLDHNLNYLFVDGLELALEGLDSEKLIGTSYLIRFPEELRSGIRSDLDEILKGNNSTFDVALSGNYYIMHGAPLGNPDARPDEPFGRGENPEILIVKQNITKLKLAEENMKTALEKEKLINEMKSRFVSLASHEFRTPLSTILSSTELIGEYIEHEGENPALIREKNIHHLKRIKSSIQNMVNTLNNFLSLDRLEQGKAVTSPSEFDMREFSAEVTDEISGKLKPGQHVEYSCGQGSAAVFIDRGILKNIVLNLLANAVKYSPENSVIKYLAKASPEGVEIIVEDRGIGIPETEQANLFERFYRAKNTLNIEGTGLGLNIVKKYIDLLNGSISFTSRENEGSVFKVFVRNAAPVKETNLINEEVL